MERRVQATERTTEPEDDLTARQARIRRLWTTRAEKGCPRGAMRGCETADEADDPRAFYFESARRS